MNGEGAIVDAFSDRIFVKVEMFHASGSGCLAPVDTPLDVIEYRCRGARVVEANVQSPGADG